MSEAATSLRVRPLPPAHIWLCVLLSSSSSLRRVPGRERIKKVGAAPLPRQDVAELFDNTYPPSPTTRLRRPAPFRLQQSCHGQALPKLPPTLPLLPSPRVSRRMMATVVPHTRALPGNPKVTAPDRAFVVHLITSARALFQIRGRERRSRSSQSPRKRLPTCSPPTNWTGRLAKSSRR